MKEFFKDIFEYHNTINKKYFSLFEANSAMVPEFSIKLMCHVLNANHIWNARINGRKPEFAIWDLYGISRYEEINNDNYNVTREIISGREFEDLISYTNSTGDNFRNSVGDILFHINNHSTHHKAQIASQLKNAGIDPPLTDYIFYKR